MEFLLDTHIALWAITDDGRLPRKAYDAICASENTIFYSIASVWEVAIKHMAHPEDMPISGRQFSDYCQRAGYRLLSLREEDIFSLETLKRAEDAPRHNDPFDRIMVAQAKTQAMFFLTHDALLPYYREPCVMFV